MHTMSYLVYLILFSIFLITDFNIGKIGIYEILVWTWATTMFLDEIRQFFEKKSTKITKKVSKYLEDKWNRYDLICYVCLLLAVILRCIPSTQCPRCFEAARIIYAITLVLSMLRILQYFYFSQTFGPQVVMIFTLLKDLPFFFFVFAVFMFAYGIFAQALLQPNSPLSWMTLYEITFTPYYAIYGQFADLDTQLKDLCGNATAALPGETSCADTVVMVFVFSAYMLFAIILLINLLVAIMNSRYDKEVDGTTTAKWLLNRHAIMQEYVQKSWLVPPLIILSHIAVIALFIWTNCHTRCRTSTGDSHSIKDFRKTQLESLNKKINSIEKSAVDEFTQGGENDNSFRAVQTIQRLLDLVSKIPKKRRIDSKEDSKEEMQIEIIPDQIFPQLNSENKHMFDDIREDLENRFGKLGKENRKLLSAIVELKREIQSLQAHG